MSHLIECDECGAVTVQRVGATSYCGGCSNPLTVPAAPEGESLAGVGLLLSLLILIGTLADWFLQ